MNFSTANPPIFGELNLPYSTQTSFMTQQAYDPYGNHLAFDDPASQMQELERQSATDQSDMSHSFSPSQPLPIHTPPNEESSGDTEAIPSISMGPPARPRKRKAPTLRAELWEPYKARILELHHTEKLPLKEVKQKIEEEFNFTAEIRQYRTRISQWGKDKNIKPAEMAAIVRKRQQRKLIEVDKRELSFTVRGTTVEPQKIDRWMNRHSVPESLPYGPSPAASTPSAVCCRTISERGSVVPSPAHSAQSPKSSPASTVSVAQSPAVFSPAISVSSDILSQVNSFAGQSPAPIYRPLPRSLPTTVQDQWDATASSLQRRYRQEDEERLREELSVAETLFGTSHSKTLEILFELGQVLIDQGRYKSAERMIRRLAEGRRTANCDDRVKRLDASELLGTVFRQQGLYAEAETLDVSVMESRKRLLGGEHPDTLISMANLASTYWSQGRWDEAEDLQVSVMEMRKKVLGEEHPHTLFSMASLASTYWSQGRLKDAEDLGLLTMEISKKVLGEEHPDTLTSMANLAIVWRGQGRPRDALTLMQSCVTARHRVLGSKHPKTVSSSMTLARWQE